MAVDWPSRGNRGKESQKTSIRRQRAEQDPKHNQSMTAVIAEQGIWFDGYRETAPTYTGSDSVPLTTTPIKDRSLTITQHLALWDKRDTLLRRANPFAMPDDIKRMTSKTKKIQPDADSQFKNAPRD